MYSKYPVTQKVYIICIYVLQGVQLSVQGKDEGVHASQRGEVSHDGHTYETSARISSSNLPYREWI